MLRRNPACLLRNFARRLLSQSIADRQKIFFKEDTYDRSQFSEMSNLWSQTS